MFEVGAKSGGAACADVAEYPALLAGQSMSPGGEKFLFVLTKDIGDFQPRFGHFRRGSLSRVTDESSRASKGLRMAWIMRLDTWR